MKIKVPVKPYQRKIIEDYIRNRECAIALLELQLEKEKKRVKKQIAAHIKFWKNNTMPVQDFMAESARIRGMDTSKCHETEVVWKKLPIINISTFKQEHGWVCKYCGRETGHKYLTCGDSRYDETRNICDCEGAAKHGKPYNQIELE